MTTKKILVHSAKGGTGKTTLAREVRAFLVGKGYRTSFYALDEQYQGETIATEKVENPEFLVADLPGRRADKSYQNLIEQGDIIIIPTRYSLLEIEPLVRTINDVKSLSSAHIIIVLNFWNRFTAAQKFSDWIREQQDIKNIVKMPNSEVFVHAVQAYKTVLEYAPNSPAGQAVTELGEMILRLVREEEN